MNFYFIYFSYFFKDVPSDIEDEDEEEDNKEKIQRSLQLNPKANPWDPNFSLTREQLDDLKVKKHKEKVMKLMDEKLGINKINKAGFKPGKQTVKSPVKPPGKPPGKLIPIDPKMIPKGMN